MQSLYTEQYLSEITAQRNRRRLLLLGILAVLLVVLVLLLVSDNHRENRPELAVTMVVILACVATIFIYDLLIHPLSAYVKHLDSALHGRSHEVTVVFDHLNEEESLVDGVVYRDLIFLGEADKHGDRDRMFYWDLELPLPDFVKGQEVTLRYFDRFITGYAV